MTVARFWSATPLIKIHSHWLGVLWHSQFARRERPSRQHHPHVTASPVTDLPALLPLSPERHYRNTPDANRLLLRHRSPLRLRRSLP
jgi:hypothetical protein